MFLGAHIRHARSGGLSEPIVYGAAYSVYVRAVRLVLAEKRVAYRLVEVDIFGAPDAAHLRRHPFGKIPAFEHDGFTLYETSAIARYVDEAFKQLVAATLRVNLPNARRGAAYTAVGLPPGCASFTYRRLQHGDGSLLS
jgi:glutathione S-transferase